MLKLADTTIEKAGGNKGEAFAARASLLVAMKEHARARADFERALTSGTAPISSSYHYALVCLSVGDLPAYRSACSEMLKQSAKAKDAGDLYFRAWTCVIIPNAVDDYAPVLDRACVSAKLRPSDQQSMQGLGATQFRAGQFDEALQTLNSSASLPQTPQTSPAYGWYFLAMTHHRLGHDDEARKWLDKAAEHTKKALASNKNESGEPLTWNRRLTLEMLDSETKALLGIPVSNPKQSAK